jgi:hypothetical protein
VQDLTALDAHVRDAAASTPECGGKHAGMRRRAVGARRRCAWAAFSATNTTEGTHAHVIVGSRGAIVPHRQPAPEGGRAAALASSRVRQSALGEGELGGD